MAERTAIEPGGADVSTIVKPVRLQLLRAKGFNLQALSIATNGLEAVNVARPSRWGNPCRVGIFRGYEAAHAVADFKRWLMRDLGVRSFENAYGKPPPLDQIKAELGGRNLACWCKPGAPCHADVLLEIANRKPEPIKSNIDDVIREMKG